MNMNYIQNVLIMNVWIFLNDSINVFWRDTSKFTLFPVSFLRKLILSCIYLCIYSRVMVKSFVTGVIMHIFTSYITSPKTPSVKIIYIRLLNSQSPPKTISDHDPVKCVTDIIHTRHWVVVTKSQIVLVGDFVTASKQCIQIFLLFFSSETLLNPSGVKPLLVRPGYRDESLCYFQNRCVILYFWTISLRLVVDNAGNVRK